MSERKEKLFFVGVKGLVVSDNQILLMKADVSRHRLVTEPYWDLPGGRIERGSDELETLDRELQEEIGHGFVGDPELVDTVFSNHEVPLETGERAGLILRVWRTEIGARAVIMSDEHIDHDWVDAATAAKLLAHKYPESFCKKVRGL